MSPRNAFATLVTEPIAQRLNYIASTLALIGHAYDRSTGAIRSNTTTGTLTSVGTVTTVTSVGSASVPVIGGNSANSLVPDSIATRWATSIRPLIT